MQKKHLATSVSEAIARRRAVRAFLPDPINRAVVESILERASLAPSGGNLQPWIVHAIARPRLDALQAEIAARILAGNYGDESEYSVYPENLWEPYRDRRRRAGKDRYAALGVTDKNEEGRLDLLRRNYSFFRAPVGLFICVDRRMGKPQWADLGMFMQNVMLLAVEEGLDTCPQEVWSNWSRLIGSFLGLPEDHMLFAGIALDRRDETDPLCAVPTVRAHITDFTTFHGFE